MSHDYFTGINYSMANEDTSLEYKMMETLKPKSILSVCGSGGRALPLIHPDAESLICVDLSQEQLWLLELRQQTISSLSFQDFLKFWGYPPYFKERFTEDRQEIFEALTLTTSCQSYFYKIFNGLRWQSLLYTGKWEQTFITLSKIAKRVLGPHCERLFEFETLEAQKAYLENEFPQNRWAFILAIVGNKTLFNALLYKGSFVKKNIKETYYQFYAKVFQHLMTEDVARNSFFLQLCLLGEIRYDSGRTIEGRRDAFQRMKDGLNGKLKLSTENMDLIQAIEKHENIDFVSMSDVPSYFGGKLEKDFLQRTRSHLSPGGVVVIRSYLRIPEADRSGYTDITKDFQQEILKEKVGVYHIEVLRNG